MAQSAHARPAITDDGDKIWLNSSYLEPVKQDGLTNKWLSKVRFSK